MKLYSGRKIDRMIARRFRTHTESRDAIVWDVDTSTGTARCKVQGSDELILCHYPQNWESIPYYVKPGFAVRIIHKGGNKGFQEISGPGRAIPSPVAGPVMPPAPYLFNGIVSGMVITPSPSGGLAVEISSGVYRISGINYIFNASAGGGTIMDDPPDATMGDDLVMGAGTNAYITFAAAPSIPLSRYDIIVVGVDGVADVVTGVAAQNPVMPAIPTGHILIGHVLIIGGMTDITDQYINTSFEPRAIHSLSFTLIGTYVASQSSMYCSLSNATPSITVRVTVLDQNGWPFATPHTISLVKTVGEGEIDANDGNWSDDGPVSRYVSGSYNYTDFRYRRNETISGPPGYTIDDTAEFPSYVLLQASIAEGMALTIFHRFELLFTEPPS